MSRPEHILSSPAALHYRNEQLTIHTVNKPIVGLYTVIKATTTVKIISIMKIRQ